MSLIRFIQKDCMLFLMFKSNHNTQLDIFKTSENFFIFELKITFFYPKKREKWSTKIQCLDYADISFIHNLKQVGQPRTFRTPENSKSWSLEVFPWSLGLWAIESHHIILQWNIKEKCQGNEKRTYFKSWKQGGAAKQSNRTAVTLSKIVTLYHWGISQLVFDIQLIFRRLLLSLCGEFSWRDPP